MSKLWDAHRLHTTIVENLARSRGTATDQELYEETKEFHEGISFRDFNRTLMKLEIEGVLRVTSVSKDLRRVELVSIS